MSIIVEQDRILRNRIRNYRVESDKAFYETAKQIGNDMHCYFELLPESDGGAYRLREKYELV